MGLRGGKEGGIMMILCFDVHSVCFLLLICFLFFQDFFFFFFNFVNERVFFFSNLL